MPAVLEEVESLELQAESGFALSGPAECYGIIAANNPVWRTDLPGTKRVPRRRPTHTGAGAGAPAARAMGASLTEGITIPNL